MLAHSTPKRQARANVRALRANVAARAKVTATTAAIYRTIDLLRANGNTGNIDALYRLIDTQLAQSQELRAQFNQLWATATATATANK